MSSKFEGVDIHFEYLWPGLIGITKDIMPIAGHIETRSPIYVIAGAAGLPWAAALGNYSAESIVDGKCDFDAEFSPYRKFPIGRGLQKILGTPLAFAISNFSVVGTL